MKQFLEHYDIIIIGAGHAGCEAGLASARLGVKTAVFCLSPDTIANLPCNPSIGGSAKGQIVSEIDALGGEMGIAADFATIQSRTLNRGKGAAVHSLRIQCDRVKYNQYIKTTLEDEALLEIKQGEIVEILTCGSKNGEGKEVCGVKTRLGSVYSAKAVIIATGTYLAGEIHVGEESYSGAADGLAPATFLSQSLTELGITLRRFKTGTPARVHKRSIDFAKLDKQLGEDEWVPFTFDTNGDSTPNADINKVVCYITYTNSKTHELIRQNLHRSPMYSGRIRATTKGARYCPSIEDKIVRFADKERHQLFIEPMGMHLNGDLPSNEYYLQGLSTSLPEEIQSELIRTIEGLENAEVIRPAYAIEYDCCDPTELFPSLQFKAIRGLFGAGQFNGTSGYEEAAAQGLIAGINAVRLIHGKEPYIPSRTNSYIGVMLDDLITKGTDEPYRMLTSRAEHRLHIRQDNAALRLCDDGYKIGLLTPDRYATFTQIRDFIENEISRAKSHTVRPNEVPHLKLKQPTKLYDLLKRPEVNYADFAPDGTAINIARKIDISIKYEGYIKVEEAKIRSAKELETKKLPPDFDYNSVSGLRLEAREKLNTVKPLNLGQASRIPGVNPADITVLLIAITGGKILNE